MHQQRFPRHSQKIHPTPVVLPALHLHTSPCQSASDFAPVPPNRPPPHTTRPRRATTNMFSEHRTVPVPHTTRPRRATTNMFSEHRTAHNAADLARDAALTSRRAAEQEIPAILCDIDYHDVGTRQHVLTLCRPVVSSRQHRTRWTCSREGTDVTRCLATKCTDICRDSCWVYTVLYRPAQKTKWLRKHVIKRGGSMCQQGSPQIVCLRPWIPVAADIRGVHAKPVINLAKRKDE